jgi:hypothetical protein
MLTHLFRWIGLRCSFGCQSTVVGIYWFNAGCAARPRQRLQCLCVQHLISAEPIDNMHCLVRIYPVERFDYYKPNLGTETGNLETHGNGRPSSVPKGPG